MVDTVKAKQTAEDMRRTADTITSWSEDIEKLDQLKDFINNGELIVRAKGKVIVVSEVSGNINNEAAENMRDNIYKEQHELDKCLSELLGGNIEPPKRKAKQPSM